MATTDTHGLDDVSWVLFDGNDITGFIRTIEDELDSKTDDATAASDTLVTSQFAGAAQFTAKLTSYYDSDLSVILEGKPTGILMWTLQGNTASEHCECVEEALCTRYKKMPENDGVNKGEADFACQGNVGALDHAWIIAPLAARGAAGDTQSAYADLGAATSSGGRWWVHVSLLDLGGYDSVTVKGQHSTDHISFGDISGATATFTDEGAAMAEFSGDVYRYHAADWSYAGSGSNPSTTFCAALTQIPD